MDTKPESKQTERASIESSAEVEQQDDTDEWRLRIANRMMRAYSPGRGPKLFISEAETNSFLP